MRILIIGFLLVLFPSLIYAQNCPSLNITPKAGNYGYHHRTGDERCEGLFTEKVSGQSLDILSFTQGMLRYYLVQNEKLTITAPLITDTGDVWVRGNNFGMYDSYRLDMKMKAGTSKRLPVSDVLLPNKITEQKLGIYGFLNDANSEITYLPVMVLSKEYDEQLENESMFYLKLATNTNIDKAEWRYGIIEDKKCGNLTPYKAVEGNTFTPQKPLEITLPPNLSKKKICLTVRYKTFTGDWSTKQFNLILP